MLPLYAHILNDIGFGVIGMIDASLGILGALLGLSFQGGIIRVFHEEPPALKPRVISTGVVLVGALALCLISIPLLLSGPASEVLLGIEGLGSIFVMALLAFWLDMIGQTAQTLLIIQRRSVAVSTIQLGRLVLGLSLNILLLVVYPLGLTGYFLSALLTSMVSTGVQLFIVGRECGGRFDPRVARNLLNFQLPLVPGHLIGWASRQAERVLVRAQIGIEAVGVLEMAYKFPVLINLLIGTPFIQAWQTKRTEIAEETGAPERIGRMFTYFLYLLVLGGLLIFVCIEPVLKLLTPEAFWPAIPIARVDVVTTIVSCCYVYLSFGLFYAKDTRTLTIINSSTSVIKIPMAYLMISDFGLQGAAYSALITGTLGLAWTFVLSQRRYRLPLEWGKILSIVAFASMLAGILVTADLRDTAASRWLQEELIQEAISVLSGSSLAEWKNGKLITMLATRTGHFAELILLGLGCALFLALLPMTRRPAALGSSSANQ
jgi:O-antigen/teichoic acid export membrane protein